MTNITLLLALKRFIQSIVGEEVGVHLFYLPEKTGATVIAGDTEFPYIILRPSKGRDQTGGASATVKLLFGVMQQDADGGIVVFNLMEDVRQALLRQRLIERVATLEDYEWEFFDEQPYPEWVGQAIARWTLPTIVQEVPNL